MISLSMLTQPYDGPVTAPSLVWRADRRAEGVQMRQANAPFRSYVLRPALGRAALISEVSALGLALSGEATAARRGNLLADQKQGVKIWRAQAGCFGPAELRSLTRLLDPFEQARSARFRFAADRCAYVLAHGLRRLALAELLGLPASAAASLRLGHNAAGRPFLIKPVGSPRWFFSHAHAREGVLFAASCDYPIGVDIESLSLANHGPNHELSPALLRRYLDWPGDGTLDWDGPAGFASGWTALESFAKALGCGLPGLQRGAPVRCTALGRARRIEGDMLRLSWHAPDRLRRCSRQEALVLRPHAPAGCVAALAVRQPVQAPPPRLDESSLDTDAALLCRLC